MKYFKLPVGHSPFRLRNAEELVTQQGLKPGYFKNKMQSIAAINPLGAVRDVGQNVRREDERDV
jgi:hypothetical protein